MKHVLQESKKSTSLIPRLEFESEMLGSMGLHWLNGWSDRQNKSFVLCGPDWFLASTKYSGSQLRYASAKT